MKIFVTGGTGFVGGYVLEALQKAGHEVHALVRPGSEHKLPPDFSGKIISGNVFDFSFPSESDAVVHLIGILRPNFYRGIPLRKFIFKPQRLLWIKPRMLVSRDSC